MTDRIRRQARVRGHVQGVFFRASVREQAERHGVAGWARNCADGSVETVLEGSADAVERVLRFLRDGPSRAEVDEVDVQDGTPSGLTGFEIR